MIFLVCALGLPAQQAPVEVVNVGPGVTPPKLIKKVEPKFSKDAKDLGLQGRVAVEVVVSDQGMPTQLRVLRPMGYGLDEEALAAVAQWRFQPAMRNGAPVNVLGTVEVNFGWLDGPRRPDPRRTEFVAAYRLLGQPNADPAQSDAAVRKIFDLSKTGLPEAMFLAGSWKFKGQPSLSIPEDKADGLALIRKAANARYGPALYVVAMRAVVGEDGPADLSTALKQMHEAAGRGSWQAQFFLGARYEEGNGLPRDLDKAEFHFRQCAYDRVPQCQYRLGRLLLAASVKRERDLIPAIVHLELAGEGGVPDARTPAANAKAKLTAEQLEKVEKMKASILRR